MGCEMCFKSTPFVLKNVVDSIFKMSDASPLLRLAICTPEVFLELLAHLPLRYHGRVALLGRCFAPLVRYAIMYRKRFCYREEAFSSSYQQLEQHPSRFMGELIQAVPVCNHSHMADNSSSLSLFKNDETWSCSAKFVQQLLFHCIRLEVLDLSGCVHFRGTTSLLGSNCTMLTRLRQLRLSDCSSIDDGFVRAILSRIPPAMPMAAASTPVARMEVLDLSGIHTLLPFTVIKIAAAAIKSTTMKWLHLGAGIVDAQLHALFMERVADPAASSLQFYGWGSFRVSRRLPRMAKTILEKEKMSRSSTISISFSASPTSLSSSSSSSSLGGVTEIEPTAMAAPLIGQQLGQGGNQNNMAPTESDPIVTAFDYPSILFQACTFQELDVAAFLIERLGVDPLAVHSSAGFSALHVACFHGHQRMAQLILFHVLRRQCIVHQIKKNRSQLRHYSGASGASSSSSSSSSLDCEACWSVAARNMLEITSNSLALRPFPFYSEISICTKHRPFATDDSIAYRELRQHLRSLVNLRDMQTSGMTPLFTASIGNHPEIVKWLIRLGADVDLVDTMGETALQHAREVGAHEIIVFLASHMRNPPELGNATGAAGH